MNLPARPTVWIQSLLVSALLAGCLNRETTGPVGAECDPYRLRISNVYSPTWDPTGTRLAFHGSLYNDTDSTNGIHVFDTRTAADRLLLQMAYSPTTIRISWSPSGDKLLLDGSLSLAVLEIASGTITPLYDEGREMGLGSWSPEGDSIYYARGRRFDEDPSAGGFWVISASGGASRPFRTAAGASLYGSEPPRFSPDGRWIALSIVGTDIHGQPANATDIFVAARDGSEIERITFMGGSARNPQWIDNDQITFDFVNVDCLATVSNPARHSWVVRRTHGAPHRLVQDLGDNRVQFSFPPAIDRSGTKVAFVGLESTSKRGWLYTMDINGANRRLVFGPPKR